MGKMLQRNIGPRFYLGSGFDILKLGIFVCLLPRQEGRSCAALDLEYGGPAMDFMKPEGFVHAVYQVLRLRPGARCTQAPVWCSWAWVTLIANQKSFEVNPCDAFP